MATTSQTARQRSLKTTPGQPGRWCLADLVGQHPCTRSQLPVASKPNASFTTRGELQGLAVEATREGQQVARHLLKRVVSHQAVCGSIRVVVLVQPVLDGLAYLILISPNRCEDLTNLGSGSLGSYVPHLLGSFISMEIRRVALGQSNLQHTLQVGGDEDVHRGDKVWKNRRWRL